tara:strand:+ start:141 stop:404 length:264 start_codon:yes stop_codon:yes gene_type:complete
MFDKFFKKVFKSRKTVSDEEAKEMEKELDRLREDVEVREAQVIKLGRLLHEDPSNSDRYAKRLNIHNRIIVDNKKKIQELEIKLLDS